MQFIGLENAELSAFIIFCIGFCSPKALLRIILKELVTERQKLTRVIITILMQLLEMTRYIAYISEPISVSKWNTVIVIDCCHGVMGSYCHIHANAKPRHLWEMKVEDKEFTLKTRETEHNAILATLLKTSSLAVYSSPFKICIKV